MSSIYDSLSNVYSLTSQINALKNQQTSTKSATDQVNSIDPKAAVYELQKDFNQMLKDLISSSDEDKDKEESDPFAFLTDYQTSLNNLNVNSYTGSVETDNLSQNNTQYNLLLEQYKLNLNNLF